MPGARVLLYAALVLVNVAFIATWIVTARRRHLHERPWPSDVAIGFVTSFLDTLGIGSGSRAPCLYGGERWRRCLARRRSGESHAASQYPALHG